MGSRKHGNSDDVSSIGPLFVLEGEFHESATDRSIVS